MKFTSVAFAIIALGTGLLAARYWYKSSKVPINPSRGPGWGLPGTGAQIEPLLPEMKALDWGLANTKDIEDTIESVQRAAELSKTAGLWTAASVPSSAISAIAGALTGCSN
jgi:hypothetical protein